MYKKPMVIAFLLTAGLAGAQAQEILNVHQTDGNTTHLAISTIDSICFSDDGSETRFHLGDNTPTLPTDGIDSLTFSQSAQAVYVHYEGSSAHIINPFSEAGITVTADGGDIIVNATTDTEVEYVLTGTATEGSFKIYSNKKFILSLCGVTLTNGDGPAINIQSGKKTTVNLMEGSVNTLTDGDTYTPCGDEDMKGTLFSEGQLIFQGKGTLQVYGHKKHGICSDDYIDIKEGRLVLRDIASDGLYANDYILIRGGELTVEAGSDALDGDAGYISISGGVIDLRVTAEASKGIKCDSTITITGGDITITTSGNAVVEAGDPSYCTAIKSNADISISGGNLTLNSTGKGGRGISADGDIFISGGDIAITTSGNGSTYTNASNQKDSYAAACIKADGDITLLDGTLTLSSSGTAGKCISTDGALTIGDDTHSPTLTAKTSGKKITLSGSGMNANYANPKAVKSEGNLTVNNGQINISTTQDGGEGLESKSILTINGGTLEIVTYDDGINAKSQLVINGGRIYCNASNNDGIDSNGTISITGGLIISSGTSTPEEGIDCDQNRFAITGGTLIATGGATSTPTASACTQRSLIYNGSALSGKVIHLQDASGNSLLTYQAPTRTSLNSQAIVLISTAGLQASTSCTLYTGGSISGTELFHGYYTDATYTPGTQAASFTPSSMVTTIGNSGGGGGFPGGGGPGGRPGRW